ncbi:hypothetical protein D3C73_1380920 [compost metagenome]
MIIQKPEFSIAVTDKGKTMLNMISLIADMIRQLVSIREYNNRLPFIQQMNKLIHQFCSVLTVMQAKLNSMYHP